LSSSLDQDYLGHVLFTASAKSTGDKLDHVNTFKISVYMMSVLFCQPKYISRHAQGSRARMYTPLKEEENVSAYLLINLPI